MPHTRPPHSASLARERLEQSRRELLRHMRQSHEGHGHRAPPSEDRFGDPAGQSGAQREGHRKEAESEPLGGAWQHIREAASAWWHAHPARLALEVAEPVLEKYARAHPMRVLALSAATGAALVLARPWRLISVTGLLVAAVKSTQVSALASAMLRPRGPEPLRPEQGTPEPATWRGTDRENPMQGPLH